MCRSPGWRPGCRSEETWSTPTRSPLVGPSRGGECSMFEELSNLSELTNLAEDSAREARAYLSSVTDVASGASPDTAVPILLLAVSQVLVAGARLGAITDVVPDAVSYTHLRAHETGR